MKIVPMRPVEVPEPRTEGEPLSADVLAQHLPAVQKAFPDYNVAMVPAVGGYQIGPVTITLEYFLLGGHMSIRGFIDENFGN